MQHLQRPNKVAYTSSTSYGHAANSLLATIDFSVSDIRKWAVMDSGATGNFLVSDAPLVQRASDDNPISVTLPDGNKIQSTHVGMLDIPQLPKAARVAHVIPGLNSHSLISVVTLCNAGCEVLFTKINVTVKYRGTTILTGSKCTRTGLWMVPLNKPTINTANLLCETPPNHQVFQPQDFYYLYDPKFGKRKQAPQDSTPMTDATKLETDYLSGSTPNHQHFQANLATQTISSAPALFKPEDFCYMYDPKFGKKKQAHQANALIPTSTKGKLARYYHQCIGSLPKSAIL